MVIDEKDAFVAALALPAGEEREVYLRACCADHPELLGRVRELLSAHEGSHGPLDRGPAPLGVTVDVEHPKSPGSVIGPYKLLEQIGEGGFGVVYMAEQTQPVRRKVALKVLKPGMDTQQVVARFEAERQALAIMDHPNIARVFDGGATPSGRPYFVMELVKGVPITDFCDRNHLNPRQRLELFISVCQAVQHAHQKGIIHRDLKPSNVLVTVHDTTPVVKVIDFGVAKALGQELTEKTLFTGFAQMIGTPLYMSPEQAGQSGLDVDTRSDIYSLGVLLYELLTSTTPFDKGRFQKAAYDEICRIIREEEPPRPSTRLSDLGRSGDPTRTGAAGSPSSLASVSASRHTEPAKLTKLFRGEVDWIVMKALEKDRGRRYETANGFAADVQRYLDGEAVKAVPPSVGYRLRKFARRNRGPVLAASLVMLALLVGIIGTTSGMIRATRAEAEAVNEAVQKTSALEEKEVALSAARQSERNARDQLFEAHLNQAHALRLSRQMGQRVDCLAAVEKASRIRFDERLRDEAIAAMALPDVRRGPSLALPAGTTTFAFDGRYETYALIDDLGVISIRGLPENVEIPRINTNMKVGSAGGLRLSPDGQFLAVLDEDHAVQIWHVADGKPLLGEALRSCWNLAFSPDSRQMAVATDDSVVCIDLANGRETRRWPLTAKASVLAFHPKNSWLAVGYANSKLVSIYDSSQGNHVADLPVGSISSQVVAWHPDGIRLAVAGSDPRIQIWDVVTQRRLAILEGHVQLVWALSFHPDGGLLASCSEDGVPRLWDPATGRQLVQLPHSVTAQFSSTGQYLGYVWHGERVQLLAVTASPEYRTIVSSLGAGQGQYHHGDISPDGRLLALGMASGGDRLWELSSRRELAVLPSQSYCVLLQPDGRELLACGDAGLSRWPIQDSKEAANELRLGPPQKIALPFAPHRAARSPNGRTLAVVSETSGAGLLLDLKSESVQGQHFAHPRSCYIALSRDGRWIASSGWHSDRVRLWNAQTGLMVNEWVLGPMTVVYFTPDSRALITCRGDGSTFWDVETFQQIRRLDRDVPHYPGHIAFSRDGKLMALEMEPAVIHLKEVATGRTVARLEDPHGDRAGWMGFTPDGTQLVVAAPYAFAIHVWDLRAIRGRLKAMGLDWEWPEFRPADPRPKAAEIRKVDVVPGQGP